MDGVLKVWTPSLQPVASRKHRGPVLSVVFVPGGEQLVTGHALSGFIVWGTDEWQEQARLMGHQGDIASLAFGPDGALATAAADGTLNFGTCKAVHAGDEA